MDSTEVYQEYIFLQKLTKKEDWRLTVCVRKHLYPGLFFLRSALVTATLKDRGTYCCSRLINYCNHRVLWYLLRSSEFNLVKALQINVSCKLHCMRKWWVQYNSGSGSVWLCLLWRNGEFSFFSSFNDELLLPIFFLFLFFWAQGLRNYHHFSHYVCNLGSQ